MRVPHIVRIAALVLATTGFYAYVGQMVPQKEVQPPQETAIGGDLSTADMVKVGRQIMEGKGFCLTCHTIGKTGALRFPDLAGVDVRAKTRVQGLNDVEYFAQSMYEPLAYVVEGFPPAMPPINKPPIGLTDQEILCVIAYLQSLGGTPTVTLQTKHHYNSGAAAPVGAPAPPSGPAPGATPGGAQPPAAPPQKGAHLRLPPHRTQNARRGPRPAVSTRDGVLIARDPGGLQTTVGAVAILQPVAAHETPASTTARRDGAIAR
jgi:cytochrome c5